MAPNVTTTLSGQKETVINGRRYTVQTNRYGEDFVVIEGKRYNLNDPVLSFAEDNYNQWEGVYASIDADTKQHETWRDKWQALYNGANAMYAAACEAGKKAGQSVSYATKKLQEITSGQEIRNLDSNAKAEAKVWQEKLTNSETELSNANLSRYRSESDTSFYGRMMCNEERGILDNSYLEAIARKMQESA